MPKKPAKAKFAIELQAASIVAASKIVVYQISAGKELSYPAERIAETATEILTRFAAKMRAMGLD